MGCWETLEPGLCLVGDGISRDQVPNPTDSIRSAGADSELSWLPVLMQLWEFFDRATHPGVVACYGGGLGPLIPLASSGIRDRGMSKPPNWSWCSQAPLGIVRHPSRHVCLELSQRAQSRFRNPTLAGNTPSVTRAVPLLPRENQSLWKFSAK